MRIWLAPAAYAPNRGGIEELTAQLAQQLQLRGHDVLVVVNRWPASAPQAEILEGVPILRLDFAAPGRSGAQLKRFAVSVPASARHLAGLQRPDVIHIQGGSSQLSHLTGFARLRKVPLVITTQGEVVMDAAQLYRRSAYQRLSLRVAARSAAALTACSSWTVEATVPTVRRFTSANVIPNAVRSLDWDELPPITGEPVLAAWGRHVPQKGFDLLLRAFDRLRQDRPDARLLLGGSGSETAALKAEAGPGVEFVGSLDRAGVRDLLSRSRVAVVPSRIEPFGIVALEALASGRRLVYSNVGGLPEAAGPMGRPVDIEDRDVFAAQLLAALDDEPVDATDWLTAFSWETVTSEYEAIYKQVISG